MLRGILEKAAATIGNVDGCVIPARSDNDTGNNPHNPLYGIAMTGASGSVVDLIGNHVTRDTELVVSCDTITRTEQTVKAVCAATVGGAVMLIQ